MMGMGSTMVVEYYIFQTLMQNDFPNLNWKNVNMIKYFRLYVENCRNCEQELLLDSLFLIKSNGEPRGDHAHDGQDGVKEEAPKEEALGNNM